MTDARKTLNSWWDSIFMDPMASEEEEEEEDGFVDGGVDENGESEETEEEDGIE